MLTLLLALSVLNIILFICLFFLLAGSQVIVNYTAHIRSHKIEVLDLPAFLTFSNASQVFYLFIFELFELKWHQSNCVFSMLQNDVSMFGPLTANLTLRVNSTDRVNVFYKEKHTTFLSCFMFVFCCNCLTFALTF